MSEEKKMALIKALKNVPAMFISIIDERNKEFNWGKTKKHLETLSSNLEKIFYLKEQKILCKQKYGDGMKSYQNLCENSIELLELRGEKPATLKPKEPPLKEQALYAVWAEKPLHKDASNRLKRQYSTYSKISERINPEGTPKRDDNKIKMFEKVSKTLPKKFRAKAQDEIETLKTRATKK